MQLLNDGERSGTRPQAEAETEEEVGGWGPLPTPKRANAHAAVADGVWDAVCLVAFECLRLSLAEHQSATPAQTTHSVSSHQRNAITISHSSQLANPPYMAISEFSAATYFRTAALVRTTSLGMRRRRELGQVDARW